MSFKTYVVRLCGPLVCESLKVTLQSDKQIFQSTVTQENGIQLYYASFTHWDVKKSLIILLYALDLPRKAFVQSRFCAMDPSLHEPVACRCWYPKYIYHSLILTPICCISYLCCKSAHKHRSIENSKAKKRSFLCAFMLFIPLSVTFLQLPLH